MLIPSNDDLKEFLIGICDNIVSYDSKSASPFTSGENYIKFGQYGRVEKGIDMPLQDELGVEPFKQSLSNYAASKKRLIIKEWPTIRQHPKTKRYQIRTTLIGDDGNGELING